MCRSSGVTAAHIRQQLKASTQHGLPSYQAAVLTSTTSLFELLTNIWYCPEPVSLNVNNTVSNFGNHVRGHMRARCSCWLALLVALTVVGGVSGCHLHFRNIMLAKQGFCVGVGRTAGRCSCCNRLWHTPRPFDSYARDTYRPQSGHSSSGCWRARWHWLCARRPNGVWLRCIHPARQARFCKRAVDLHHGFRHCVCLLCCHGVHSAKV
jgi:hypothetical protein